MEEGKVHRAFCTTSTSICSGWCFSLSSEMQRGSGRGDLAGLRGRPRAQARRSARSGPSGSVLGTSVPAAVHTEAGWQTTPARGRGTRGQDRPEGSARGAQRDLRGKLPRVSYRFRPKRSQHDALDALVVGISSTKVNWILDAHIHSLFDSVSQHWLVRFQEHRIGDPRIIRLIRKWLKAGILEEGAVTVRDVGTGQGSVISPLLANVYLHYVFDLWAERWRRREACGDMIIVRYADDLVAMRVRFEEFMLSLHPEKTRLIEFGRHAAAGRARRGLSKPETFMFLGFTYICGRSRRGNFLLQRKSRGDPACGRNSRRSRRSCDGECTTRSLSRDRGWRKLFEAASPTTRCRPTMRHSGRSDTGSSTSGCGRYVDVARTRMLCGNGWSQIADGWLPRPRILHPWPNHRFDVKHPRSEPYA